MEGCSSDIRRDLQLLLSTILLRLSGIEISTENSLLHDVEKKTTSLGNLRKF